MSSIYGTCEFYFEYQNNVSKKIIWTQYLIVPCRIWLIEAQCVYFQKPVNACFYWTICIEEYGLSDTEHY